jgi:hypothetical protein
MILSKSFGQSVLVSGTHLWPATNFSSSIFNYFWTVTDLLMWAPSLTRGRVSTFQSLLGITSAAFLMYDSYGTDEHISVSLFLRLHLTAEPGSCIYFPHEQGSPVIPRALGWRILFPFDFQKDVSSTRTYRRIHIHLSLTNQTNPIHSTRSIIWIKYIKHMW